MFFCSLWTSLRNYSGYAIAGVDMLFTTDGLINTNLDIRLQSKTIKSSSVI